MVLITIHCKPLNSVSHAWRESSTEENFRPAEAGGQMSHWAWYIVIYGEK